MASGAADVHMDNAETVGDFRVLFERLQQENGALRSELERVVASTEQQLAQIRIDARTLAASQQAQQALPRVDKIDLIDVKSMSPSSFSGAKTEPWKAWAKKVKAFTNAKLSGFRDALSSAEKIKTVIDGNVVASWGWPAAVEANSKLHDMLMLITSSDAQGIVESVPGQGFDAWRLLNERYNSVGEMYTLDKMNAIMEQVPTKTISGMPASIAKFEKVAAH